MLARSKDVLQAARTAHRGVVAPDFIDLDSARCFVETADKLHKPIILSFAQAHRHMISLEEAALIGGFLAKRVDAPIVLHLDHGEDFDYIEQAVKLGFNSVMLDASMHDFAENVRLTKEVVRMAHAAHVDVEAEIGHVGGSTEGGSETESVYTTVEEASAFAEQTGVDSLAVSIGTSHGVYKNNKNPQLNFERLAELRAAVPIPLVLHGGSGTGDENLRRAVETGITKVNVFTEFLTSAFAEIQTEKPDRYATLKCAANEGMKKTLEHYIRLITL